MNSLLSDSFEIPKGQPSGNGDIEMGVYSLQQVLQNWEWKNANEEFKSVTRASSAKEIKQSMEKDVNEVGKIAQIAKSKVEELDRDNLANRQKSGCGKGSAVDRSRTATTVALKRKLKERISDFQSLREAIKQEYRVAVARSYFTVTGNHADEETIDRLIETGHCEQIFQRAILEQGRGQIMDTFTEILEHRDIVRELERKLLELQQIFVDMAILIDSQGDMLNDIASQVSSAIDHVHSGTESLQKAKRLMKSSHNWPCIAILILLVIILLILLTVVLPFAKPWKKISA